MQMRDGDGKRPWSLQKDSDLWQTLAQLIEDRGHQSTIFTWCKGHATLHHIATHFTTSRNAAYNGLADATADLGYTLECTRTQSRVLNYFAAKLQRCVTVFLAVAKRIARVAKAANDRLKIIAEAAAKRDALGVATPPVPAYPRPAAGIYTLPLKQPRRYRWNMELNIGQPKCESSGNTCASFPAAVVLMRSE